MTRLGSSFYLPFLVVLCLVVALVGCGGSSPNDELVAPPVGSNQPDAAPPATTPAAIRITTTGMPTTTEAGGRATFAVALSAKPSSEVVVPIASPTPAEIKADPTALTFGPNDWDQPKAVTLIGVDEDVDDGDQKVLIGVGPSTSSDAAWNGVRSDGIEALNKDDDVAGIEVSAPTPSSSTTETGTSVTFSVRLKSRPSAPVTIGVTSSVPTEGAVDKAQLVFDPVDWQTARTVVVTGQDDLVADQDKAYDVDLAKPVTSDPAYAALSASKVALTNLDDDTPGFFVFAPAPNDRITTEAGGTMSFIVRLRSKPNADVTIPISSTKTAEGSLQGVTQLVFTPANYNQGQTVIVKGVDDKVDDGDQAYTVSLAAATSTDATYLGKDPPDVDATNKDDDTASILVSAPSAAITTEAGSTVTFTVKLASEPTAPVTLSVVSSKPTEGTADKAQLVFDSANWNVAQTVTVKGQNDAVDDGDQPYVIQITHMAGSVTTDAKYAAIEPSDVSLTNSDDDTQGVTVAGPNNGTFTTEGGASVTIDVVLKTKPTGDVTIPVSISNNEAKANTALLTFTTGNWDQIQTITVTGEDDFVDDGDREFTVVLGTATGGGYNVNPDDVTLENKDNDTANIQQSASLTGTLTEVGGQVKFKVRLASRPAGTNTVVVPITISAGNATRLPTTLTFTTGNWDQEQEVTVTGGGDGLLASTAPSVSISVGPATSGDPKYAGLSSAGYANITNTSACGIGGTNPGEGETCDDANATKCDGCETCVKQSWALIPKDSKITTGSSAPVTAAGTTMCIEAWAKLAGGADGIIAAAITNSTDINFALTCDPAGRLTFASQNGVDLLVAEALGTTCANNDWHHVAGCRSLAGVNLTYYVFLDGALLGTSAVGTTAAIGSAAPISFGEKFTLGTAGLDGALDEVHLHTTLRTASYTPPVRHAVATANTVAIWRFNEGSGTTSASIPTNYAATLGAGAGWANDTGYSAAVCQ